jgi:hypothetical protein
MAVSNLQNADFRHLRLVQAEEQAAGQQEARARAGLSEIDAANTAQTRALETTTTTLSANYPQPVTPLSTGTKPQSGLMTSFSNTCYRWQLPEEEHLLLLGYQDNHHLGQQILYGRLNAPQDTRARASCIVSISIGLGALFNENATAELHWLQAPNSRLGGKTPLGLMLEGDYLYLFAVQREVHRVQGLRGD